MGAATGVVFLIVTDGWKSGHVWALAFIVGIGAWFASIFLVLILKAVTDMLATRSHRSRMARSPIAARLKRYDEALTAFYISEKQAENTRCEAERTRRIAAEANQRKLVEHWMSLSGQDFETELAVLYRQLGFTVESTPATADKGIDLFLRKSGRTTVVQCKSHQQPVGPATVRELYGAMTAAKADKAILACTGGFTKGVLDFVKGKPIALVSATELVTLAQNVKQESIKNVNPDGSPTCPASGCGSRMVRRRGKYGQFWGCVKYPRCRGWRKEVS